MNSFFKRILSECIEVLIKNNSVFLKNEKNSNVKLFSAIYTKFIYR